MFYLIEEKHKGIALHIVSRKVCLNKFTDSSGITICSLDITGGGHVWDSLKAVGKALLEQTPELSTGKFLSVDSIVTEADRDVNYNYR